ncbi:MAG: metallophosphoesterase [Bacteroidales bacterium]
MKEKFIMITLFVLIFILVVDLYTFKGIKLLASTIENNIIKYGIYIIYWSVPLLLLSFLIYYRALAPFEREPAIFKNFFLLGGFFILFYVPKLVFIIFHLAEDIIHIGKWVAQKISSEANVSISGQEHEISRAKFLTQIGIITAAIPFVSILFGMAKGRFNFRISHEKLSFRNLPESFDGFRIIQISDIHIGSFYGHEGQVKKAVELINEQKPDLILFTGDLVNNFAEELNGWIPIFKQLKAKHGMYAVLGNHDYGDYYDWKDEDEKIQNLERIKQAFKEIGFKLLLNETSEIEVNNEKFALIGIENWGLPPFPQYGDLELAMNGLEESGFKLLMSHDPSHWDAEVIKDTTIDLTLSGHTHGMQFGINIGKKQWSPAKFKYPRWAGLYQEKNQYLYVNRGFGYIGFPGRVGMPPEITVIDLKKI